MYVFFVTVINGDTCALWHQRFGSFNVWTESGYYFDGSEEDDAGGQHVSAALLLLLQVVVVEAEVVVEVVVLVVVLEVVVIFHVVTYLRWSDFLESCISTFCMSASSTPSQTSLNP